MITGDHLYICIMEVKIYTLSDPNTGEIRYVGRTKNSLSKRLNEHVCRSRSNHGTYKKHWINTLLKQELRPVIEEIDSCNGWQESYNLERFWIELLISWGCKLTNCKDKGVGHLSVPTNAILKNSKAVRQYDLFGNFIAEFSSAREAERKTQCAAKKISLNAKGERKSCGGFIWLFASDNKTCVNKYNKGNNSKPAYQYDSEYNLIKKWNSLVEASIFYNYRFPYLVSTIFTGSLTKLNHRWSYIEIKI